MKKLFSIVLALTMVLAMTACGSKTTAETTVPAQEMPASALEIMETVCAEFLLQYSSERHGLSAPSARKRS